MGATSITSNSHWYSVPSSTPTAFSSQLKSSFKRPSLGFNSGGAELFGRRLTQSWCTAINGRGRGNVSAWDDEPYEVLLGGKKSYLDEQDVVSFLDPPRELIPLDSASYNPAAYLWKKIGDIPEERRKRLLHLLEPRLISRAWEIAGTRYEDPKLASKNASSFLSDGDGDIMLEAWNCRTSGGPLFLAWLKFFKKAIFCSKNREIYGRFHGESGLAGIASSISPLYFKVRQLKEVMSTEQPCDRAYEFGDGLFDLHEYPRGFPRPMKHPWPFNDQVIVYVRYVGPGLLIGQAWQEGAALEQVPRKLFSEILMVKDYASQLKWQ